jgi:serine protease Do
LAKALKLEDRKGALVGDVVSASPAERAGIRRGDVIIAFNDKTVEGARDLPALVAKTPVGQEVSVTILRNGVKHQLPITVGKLPSEPANGEESSKAAKGTWGNADHGVVVAGVQPGSPADLAGIHKGDVILQVNRQPANSVKDVTKIIAKVDDEETLLLLVKRDRGSFFVALEKKA